MSRSRKNTEKIPNLKAIFIHALFRTGSTYTWNKFRQNKKYYCYYDPFHYGMGNIDTGKPQLEHFYKMNAVHLRHPTLDKEYTDEYLTLIPTNGKGVPYFRKRFTIDDYCNNTYNPDQKIYIDFLIKVVYKNHIPVFKSNLSPMRISWFKENYPDALHIYQVRNPKNQFQSALDMAQNGIDLFLTTDLMIGSLNRNTFFYKTLATYIPLFEFHSESFQQEYSVYKRMVPIYNAYEKYFIFYYNWFYSLVENVLKSDIVIYIDQIDVSKPYRKSVIEELNNMGAGGIDFDDATPWDYKHFPLRKNELALAEKTVQSIILRQYSEKKIETFCSKLDPQFSELLDLNERTLMFLRKREMDPADLFPTLTAKSNRIFEIFGESLRESNKIPTPAAQMPKDYHDLPPQLKHELMQTRKELTEKIQSLQEKDRQILQRDQQLEDKDKKIAEIEKRAIEELEAYKKEVEQKEETIKRFQSRKDILDLVLQLHDKDQALEEKDKLLAQKDWELKDLELRTNQKLETYTSSIEQKDDLLKQKNQHIAEIEQKLASILEADQSLKQNELLLSQKSQAYERLLKQLDSKNQQIHEKDIMLKKKDSRMETLFQEKNNYMMELEEKDKKIDLLTEEIKFLSSNGPIVLMRKLFGPAKEKKD